MEISKGTETDLLHPQLDSVIYRSSHEDMLLLATYQLPFGIHLSQFIYSSEDTS